MGAFIPKKFFAPHSISQALPGGWQLTGHVRLVLLHVGRWEGTTSMGKENLNSKRHTWYIMIYIYIIYMYILNNIILKKFWACYVIYVVWLPELVSCSWQRTDLWLEVFGSTYKAYMFIDVYCPCPTQQTWRVKTSHGYPFWDWNGDPTCRLKA